MTPASHRRLLTGKALRALRGSRSLREIAEMTGLSHATIREAEGGRISSIGTFLALADVYGQRIVLHEREVWLEDGVGTISLADAIQWIEESMVPITLNLGGRIVAASGAVATMLGLDDPKELRGVDPRLFVDLHGETGDRGRATIIPFKGPPFPLRYHRRFLSIEGKLYEVVEGERA